MSFTLPSGPLPDAETLRRLQEKGQLPDGLEPPLEIIHEEPESEASKLKKQGPYYFGLD